MKNDKLVPLIIDTEAAVTLGNIILEKRSPSFKYQEVGSCVSDFNSGSET